MIDKPYVFAVHICNKDGHQPMADIILSHYERVTIRWDEPAEREKYYFNAYTLYYDARPKQPWSEWLNRV